MRRIAASILAVTSLVLLSLVAAAPAQAHDVQSFTLSTSTASTGTTVTATASWEAIDSSTAALQFVLPAGLAGLATWSVPTATPTMTACVAEATPGVAECLWNAAHVTGDVATLTASFTIPSSVAPGNYTVLATTDPASSASSTAPQPLEVIPSATSAMALTPASVNPGQSVTPTATYTATSTGNNRVGVYILGTSSTVASLVAPAATTGLSNCALDGSLRAYTCDWTGATVGDTRTLQPTLAIASSAPVGTTFTLEACANPNTSATNCSSVTVTVTAASTPVTPTPDNELAATGADTRAMAVTGGIGSLLLALGAALLVLRRRALKR